MSLLDKASLIVTPNAYKESKLYSVIPTSGAGDMTVVRATTATRKNSAGFIEVVPRNLFTYSEEFNNSDWSKFQATITANNTTAPNGTLTADKLESSTNGTAVLFRTASTGAGVSTISVYAKAGTNNILDIGFTNVSDFTVKANLTTGTITSATSGITGTITSVGNGWYRVTATRTMTASGTGFINNANNISGRFIYIWGGQLDLGNVTEYFPTTTRLNIPRIDYTNGSCPSLLVEPQRTNLLTYSEQFDNVIWAKQNATVTANTTTSPSGVSNADSLIASNGTANFKGLYTAQGSAAPKSFSFFAKKGNKDWAILLGYNGDNNCWFNVSNGTIGTIGSNYTNAKIENFGNGWYRCSATLNTLISGTNLGIYVSNANNSTSCTGDGSTPSLYIWGAQCEAGAYASSYIPTVASTVTRNFDQISKTGISSLIGQTEGTIFFDGKLNDALATTKMIFQLTDGTDNNRIQLSSFSSTLFMYIIKNNAVQLNISSAISNFTDNKKIAFVYSNNNFKLFINGALISTNTSLSVPNTSVLNIGSYSTFGQNNFLNINSIQLYKTALSDTECIALTTI